MPLLEEAQDVNKTYQVERLIGEGAFAEVYRVKHRFLGRQAMKVFKSPGLTIEAIEQQLEEAVLLSQMGHPNIIRVFDANVLQIDDQNYGYFTMEYIPSGSLDQLWRSYRFQLMPVDIVVDLMIQACRGLSVAHSMTPPIVHRDIKPKNLLVGYDGDGLHLRISDFGLAKHANPLTLLVSARGTPSFKAPEVYRQSNVDFCAGDVWAVGCTIYVLLTDQLPFPLLEKEGFGQIPIFEKPLVPPSSFNLNVDPYLEGIVMKALSKPIKDRYNSAIELLADLARWGSERKNRLQDKVQSSTERAKAILGPVEVFDREEAEKLVKESISLAQSFQLAEAADAMEQAFNKWPALREQYEGKLTLWRKGITN